MLSDCSLTVRPLPARRDLRSSFWKRKGYAQILENKLEEQGAGNAAVGTTADAAAATKTTTGSAVATAAASAAAAAARDTGGASTAPARSFTVPRTGLSMLQTGREFVR